MTTADIANAYAGRLGHMDDVYADPNLAALGPHGQPEEPTHVQEPEAVEPPAEKPVEEETGLDEFTVAELKKELDALGVEYPSGARKAELIELVRQAEEES